MQNNIILTPPQQFQAALTLAVVLAMATSAYAAENDSLIWYGQANVSYDIINTGTTKGSGSLPGTTSSRLSSNSSLIGLKASSDLGGGWSVLAQAEVTLGTDTGASGCQVPDAGTPTKSSQWRCFFDRNTYLGVSNTDLGTLLAGRHDTPYKMATRSLDIFEGGIADSRSLMGTTILGGANRDLGTFPVTYSNNMIVETFDVRLSNLIMYMSPKLGGFSISIGYSNMTESNNYADQPNGSAVSVAGMYQQDDLYATIAYEDHSTNQLDSMGNDLTTTVKATKLGLGYKWGILDLGFVYEKSRDTFGNIDPYDPVTNPCGDMMIGANCSGHSTSYLSAKLNFTEKDAIKLAYTKAGQVGAASTDSGAFQFSMGLDHEFNEVTTGYFLFSTLKNDELVRYGFSTAATSGDNSVNPTGSGGAAPAVFSIGMRYSF